MAQPVLFIQGGGAGVHDEWDDKLVASLRASLGRDFNVSYPRMPAEDDPNYGRWSAAIRDELTVLADGAIVVAHSVGATIVVNALAERPHDRQPAAILLISAPFVGEQGWPGEDFVLPSDLGSRLPQEVAVHVFHGLSDETVPASHAHLYARAIPQARLHVMPGKDHQLGNDLREVAEVIKAVSRT